MSKIIYTCPYVPGEWIAAHGLGPVRVMPRHLSDHEGLGRVEGLCAFVKAYSCEVLADADCGGAVFTTACDQMRRAYDVVKPKAGCATFLMNVPSTWRSGESKKLYVDELGRLGRWLCTLGGRSPANALLAETMIGYDEKRQSQRAVERPCDDDGGATALAIVGGPMLESDFDIFEIIEQAGGRVVLDATETGELGLCDAFDKRRLADDAMGELARAYFEFIPAVWKRPNDGLFEWLQAKCAERGVRGIIYHRFVWCDVWHAELYRVRESLGLPVLDLDVSGDGHCTLERTVNRIQAFLETLQ